MVIGIRPLLCQLRLTASAVIYEVCEVPTVLTPKANHANLLISFTSEIEQDPGEVFVGFLLFVLMIALAIFVLVCIGKGIWTIIWI
jgi:hypothetical protein